MRHAFGTTLSRGVPSCGTISPSLLPLHARKINQEAMNRGSLVGRAPRIQCCSCGGRQLFYGGGSAGKIGVRCSLRLTIFDVTLEVSGPSPEALSE